MSSSVRISGVYKSAAPYVKVGGAWKFSKEAWSNVDGNWKQFFLAGGLDDTSFIDGSYTVSSNNPGPPSGATGTVRSVAIQSDGKIILGGVFTTFNSITARRIIRLNSDGTIDTAFTTNTGTGAGNAVLAIAIQSDGKIILGGAFAGFNGSSTQGIVRLNSDGTNDTAFNANLNGGINGLQVNSIKIQSDNKILVGGSFQNLGGVVNGIYTTQHMVRLNSNGTRDTAFTVAMGNAFSNEVLDIAIQSDGKIIVVGVFTLFNLITVNRIVRLNSDGTRDTAFTTNTGTALSSYARSIAIQSDGKIIVVGVFATFNGVTVNRIVRLNSDGTRDTAFTTNTGTGTGASGEIYDVAIQSDGKIVIVGNFPTFNGTTVNSIAKLNSDGTRDTTFTTNTGTAVFPTAGPLWSLAIQSDSKIIIVGEFTTFNSITPNHVNRLNSDGTVDVPFLNSFIAANAVVRATAVQPDGKIILGGAFTYFNGVRARVLRLNPNGTIDTSFTPILDSNGVTNTIAIQADGKILVGGQFSTVSMPTTVTVNRIVRLNSDGTRDTDFTTNAGTAFSADVSRIVIQPDGKIIVGGTFATFNGTTVNRIARLNPNGTLDTAFAANTGTGTGVTGQIESIIIQSDQKIILSGFFGSFNGTTGVTNIVRLNSDGTRDTAFTTNTGTGPSGLVSASAIQSDGKIVIGGQFTGFNGTTVNRIARLNSNGTLDTAFTTNTGTGSNSEIMSIAIQLDDKIVIGGFTTLFNGASVGSIVRLNANGTIDTDFRTNTGIGATLGNINNEIRSIRLQSDGKVIIGGNFTLFNNKNRGRITRIGGDLAS
jgi:uncharacterized delta-60 repeat protein